MMIRNDEQIGNLARKLSESFTNGPRLSEDTNRQIRILSDGAPEWAQDVCREAHGDMMPDDWRYEMIEAAADALADADGDESEARERLENDVLVYTADLVRWLGSHGDRCGYCDEAIDEYGADVGGITNLIQLGYLAEQTEVLSLLTAALSQVAESEDDDE